jgi:hypothetical protein
MSPTSRPSSTPPMSDAAVVFHRERRLALFQLLTGRPMGSVSDAQMRGAIRAFCATHTEQEYQAIESKAYLCGYNALAAMLKQKRST